MVSCGSSSTILPSPTRRQSLGQRCLLCRMPGPMLVVNISHTYLAGGDFVAVAGAAAAELYGYGHSNVLFKPTLASVNQFRPTANGALSYFVGNSNVANGYAEDGGFAINGGKGWSAAVFENHQIEINGNVAAAMGNYYFTSADDGNVSKVEYSFNYKRTEDGKLADLSSSFFQALQSLTL